MFYIESESVEHVEKMYSIYETLYSYNTLKQFGNNLHTCPELLKSEKWK